jgi:uncharacterized protein (DUF736 family)
MSDNNTTKNDWEKRELGALWTKVSQGSGKKYFSGHIKVESDFGEEKKINVVAFHNKDKKSENQPDFRIYLSKPRSSEGEPALAEAAGAPSEASSSESDDLL